MCWSHNQVRGHITGSSHSGVWKDIPEKERSKPKAVYTYIIKIKHIYNVYRVYSKTMHAVGEIPPGE